jgi:copper chaperone CopZ
MADTGQRYIEVIHLMPGRARLRLAWLRDHRDEAARVADAVAALPGIQEVKVNPYTGSVLSKFEGRVLGVDQIITAIQTTTGVDQVVALGERAPAPAAREPLPHQRGRVAREVDLLFKDFDRQVLRSSRGSFDLGTAVTLGFMGAGALRVLIKRQISPPDWFQLAWWGFRTFMDFESHAADEPEVAESPAESPAP